MMTDHRILSGLARSSIAASSNSRGRVMKYWRNKKTSYAFAKNAGTIKGSHVPTQLIIRKNGNEEAIITAAGRKMVEMSAMNRRNITGKPKREKPNALKVQEMSTPIVVTIA